MIAIDTHVLLRYLLQDDKRQAAKAAKLISGPEPVLITDVVLVETLWTLKGKKYSLHKHDLLPVLDLLFREPNLVFEDSQTVLRAFNHYRTAAEGSTVDFADTLILEKSQYIAAGNEDPYEGLYTFDKALQQFKQTRKP